MEIVTKLLLVLITVFLVAFPTDVVGARMMKSNVKVVQPDSFFGSPDFGTWPIPGMGGTWPFPGTGGSFPSPGLGGSSPSPTSPGPGFGSPGVGGGFCSFFPGSAACAPPPSGFNSGDSDSTGDSP
ncbi:Translation initiation factor IF-2 [Camellia lanceoleosa]|uniref:Translation initiation factor IF-2 n=1 Tax=Camellia lanceoleosa TaxID=1840588 RepID=A0ACC0IIV8_9ERIC|nr:Translation initiation factor IF-2 [Camellia lanceoleosa]